MRPLSEVERRFVRDVHPTWDQLWGNTLERAFQSWYDAASKKILRTTATTKMLLMMMGPSRGDM